MAAQPPPPPVADKEMVGKEKDKGDVEKVAPHSSADDSSDVADSTLAALQRVKSADEHHPMHWSSAKKWFIVFWYCLLQVFVTLTTTTYVSAEFLVTEQYGGTTQVITLGQSMFIIGTAIGPAFLGPLSYVVSRALHICNDSWGFTDRGHHLVAVISAGANGSTSCPSSSTRSSTSAAPRRSTCRC